MGDYKGCCSYITSWGLNYDGYNYKGYVANRRVCD